jgi:hypothetical protein
MDRISSEEGNGDQHTYLCWSPRWLFLLSDLAATPGVGRADGPGGVHCETGIHEGPPRSLSMNVIEPVTFTDVDGARLIFPPEAKVTSPLNG